LETLTGKKVEKSDLELGENIGGGKSCDQLGAIIRDYKINQTTRCDNREESGLS